MVYSNTAVSRHLYYFHYFEVLKDAFDVLIFRALFLHTITGTDNMYYRCLKKLLLFLIFNNFLLHS